MNFTRRQWLQLSAACSLLPVLPSYAASVASSYTGLDVRVPISKSNPAISFDPDSCIECGSCKAVCQKMMSINGFYNPKEIAEPICVHCGQCTTVCEGDALTNKEEWQKVAAAVADPEMTVVVSTSPAVRVALGEEFGLPAGSNVEGKMVAALKALGVNYVLDTVFAADMTILEEASELVQRIVKKTAPLPQFTSCCPAWVKFVETYEPSLLPNISSAKSPIGMQGPTIKTYFAEKKKINPKKIFNVALTPCTAKKFEIRRPEMNASGEQDMDAVITTRELALWMKSKNVSLDGLTVAKFDDLMGEGSGAGVIFGNTGGVMEAALRTAYFYITKKNPPDEFLNYEPVRGLDGVRTATVTIADMPVTVAVVHGLANARAFVAKVKDGTVKAHFIEVMACVGGCIGGGGQPRAKTSPYITQKMRKARISGLYSEDSTKKIRLSHENQQLKQLYTEFYGQPLSAKAKKLLHTTYINRSNDLKS